MKTKVMLLEVQDKCEDYSRVILKEMGTENMFSCSSFTTIIKGCEVGAIFEACIDFKLKNKIIQDRKVSFQKVLLKELVKVE